MIVAIEGIDGAGKNTFLTELKTKLHNHYPDLNIDTLSFPRYDDSIHAKLAYQSLHRDMGRLSESAVSMALLFALDRYESKKQLEELSSQGLVLCDRYVASNAAYSWARLTDETIIDWVDDLEFSFLGIPKPDLSILLETPPDEASLRTRKRETADSKRKRDQYEKNDDLQINTWNAYKELANKSWKSKWLVTHNPEDVADELFRLEIR